MITTNTNMFEQAVREKLRFQTSRGSLTVEELLDLSLTALDGLAKGINKTLKESEEGSFIPNSATRRTKEYKNLALQLEILKYVITTKVEESDAAKTRAAKLEKAARIRELIEQKDEESFKQKSRDELEALLKEIEG